VTLRHRFVTDCNPVNTIDDFENALKQSPSDDGITIVDVPMDYTCDTELVAQLHEGVFE
jgi:acetolactate synthase-1/2/3 large subunit